MSASKEPTSSRAHGTASGDTANKDSEGRVGGRIGFVPLHARLQCYSFVYAMQVREAPHQWQQDRLTRTVVVGRTATFRFECWMYRDILHIVRPNHERASAAASTQEVMAVFE